MSVELVYIGVTHKTAGPEIRERLAAGTSGETRPPGPGIEQAVLSTCGRYELYLGAESGRLAQSLTEPVQYLLRKCGNPVGVGPEHVNVLHGLEAANHLLRVAAGLESQVLGEEEVLGQVRAAFRDNQDAGNTGPILSALFRAAIHTGKRVRHETILGRCARSFARAAAECAAAPTGRLAEKRIIVLGTGKMARSVLRELRNWESGRLAVIGRSYARAQELASHWAAAPADIAHLPQLLTDADVLITCTGSPTPLVTAGCLGYRTNRLTIIDLGLPRNVQPTVARAAGVDVYDLDQVAAWCPIIG